MSYDEEESMEEKSFSTSDFDDEAFSDDLEPLDPIEGADLGIEDDDDIDDIEK